MIFFQALYATVMNSWDEFLYELSEQDIQRITEVNRQW